MADGSTKRIEEIVEGDMVFSASEALADGPVRLGRVVAVHHNPPSALLAVRVAGEEGVIRCTAEHCVT
jgi:hypothetical protein